MNSTSESEFVSSLSPETNQRQAGDVSPVSSSYKGGDRDNRRAERMLKQPATNPLALFDTQASIVETDLNGDDFLALCGNTAWRITWLERSKKRGYQWRVKAVRITSSPSLPLLYARPAKGSLLSCIFP